MTHGIIYIAIGKKYIEETLVSVVSLKNNTPNLPITIFCGEDIPYTHHDNVTFKKIPSYYKDKSMSELPYNQLVKLLYMSESPYEYTLFLDTDTYICDDISEMFLLLNKFDMGVALAPGQTYPIEGVPDCFAELNTGVVLFKKSPQMRDFFLKWLTIYKRNCAAKKNLLCYQDQPAFREALYYSNLKFVTMKPEYNCRFIFPGYVYSKVKILHGRHSDLPAVADAINEKFDERRTFYLDNNNCIKTICYTQKSTKQEKEQKGPET